MAEPDVAVATDLAPIVDRAADAFRAPRFAVDICPSASPTVAVPAPTLEAVLTTLLENARQAGAARIEIHITTAHGRIALHVRDDGPGYRSCRS